MNVVIRTDASIGIGTGHVMRCLTLAKQLERHGVEVTFICRNLEGNSNTYLQSQGMRIVILPSAENNVNWKLDALETITIIKALNIEVDLVIVDHYGLDSHWESELRHYTRHLMVIDDLADRPHDCDLLLDQNYYLDMKERYKRLVPDHCVQMLGPDYVLLRDEFLQAANEPRERTGEIKNILVFFGGTDPTEETIKALEAIKELDISEIEINVVVGASNPKCHEIKLMCEGMLNTSFHCQVSNMAELMWKADLAIGAGGSMTWERCFLGLPSLTIVVAVNQSELTKAIAKLGTSVNMGWYRDIGVIEIKKTLNEILQTPFELKGMEKRCFEVINRKKVLNYPVAEKIVEMCL